MVLQGLGAGVACAAAQVVLCTTPRMPSMWNAPSTLVWQPSGRGGSGSPGGSASPWAPSSEGQPVQLPRHYPVLVGIWHWVGHGQPVSMFFWGKPVALTWDGLLGSFFHHRGQPGETLAQSLGEAVMGFGENSRWPSKLDS